MRAQILPKKVPLATGRGFPAIDDASPSSTQRLSDADLEDLQRTPTGGAASGLIARAMRDAAQEASRGSGGTRMSGLCHNGGALPPPPAVSSPEQPDPLSYNQVGGQDRVAGADAELLAMSQAGGGGGYFEDRVFGLMCKVVEDFQKQIEQRLQKLQAEAQAAEAQGGQGGQGGGGSGQESRNIEFEKIKYDMQKLSQMQQAMSNVLNTMDELAKSAIRQIKAT